MTPLTAATHLLHLAGRVGTWALYRVVDAWDAADTRLASAIDLAWEQAREQARNKAEDADAGPWWKDGRP